MSYKASKSGTKGREGWCVIFRHPLRLDKKNGKPKRVRKGLTTKEENEADRLVEQLNTLLEDQSYWTPVARERAAKVFDQRVVSIFYDDMDIKHPDPWTNRDKVISLKGQEEGYTRVQLIGSTGAGKTTLLRQIVGSDPQRDRFPSTSTAKTTVFDIEIMFAESPYRAVVSFISNDEARQYVEDCVTAALCASAEGAATEEVLRKLSQHTEQRFRLSYLLGNLRSSNTGVEEPLVDEDEETLPAIEASEIDEQERVELENRLRGYLGTIAENGKKLWLKLANGLSKSGVEEFTDPRKLKKGELDVFEELLEDEARENEGVQALIDEIYDEIESKFRQLKTKGSFIYDRSDWPQQWYFETDDRSEFIKEINRFSSNYAPNFGYLLTPLVSGMRVAGPFKPEWDSGEYPKLVLIDGEGLGHTTSTMLSLPATVTRRYDKTDVILLVDSATQPMLAGPQTVLRSVCSSGYESKLAIAFTHFDQVKGDNLQTINDRKNHIWASLDNVICSLDNTLNTPISKSLKRALESKVFFFAKINETLPASARATISDLKRLIEFLKSVAPPPKIAIAVPVYNISYLSLSAQFATKEFHKNWMARLGLAYESGIPSEHWTRIKALSRRFAEQWSLPEYADLRPIADLTQLLQEKLTSFISSPQKWQSPEPNEDDKQAAIEKVKREVFSGLQSLIMELLYVVSRKEWISAFEQRGFGSTRIRAGEIREIYQIRTPLLGEVPSQEAFAFLELVQKMFREAADRAGAKIII